MLLCKVLIELPRVVLPHACFKPCTSHALTPLLEAVAAVLPGATPPPSPSSASVGAEAGAPARRRAAWARGAVQRLEAAAEEAGPGAANVLHMAAVLSGACLR